MTIPDEAVEAALNTWYGLSKKWKGDSGLKRDMRAALSAAAPMMSGWRKIEGEPDTAKAPWDGNEVLVCGGRVTTSNAMSDWEHRGVSTASWNSLHACWDGGWAEGSQEEYTLIDPTHWQPMPLPAAPQPERETDRG